MHVKGVRRNNGTTSFRSRSWRREPAPHGLTQSQRRASYTRSARISTGSRTFGAAQGAGTRPRSTSSLQGSRACAVRSPLPSMRAGSHKANCKRPALGRTRRPASTCRSQSPPCAGASPPSVPNRLRRCYSTSPMPRPVLAARLSSTESASGIQPQRQELSRDRDSGRARERRANHGPCLQRRRQRRSRGRTRTTCKASHRRPRGQLQCAPHQPRRHGSLRTLWAPPIGQISFGPRHPGDQFQSGAVAWDGPEGGRQALRGLPACGSVDSVQSL